MSIHHLLVGLLLLALSQTVLANNDLVNCRYGNGNAIAPKVCDLLRSAQAREKEEQAAREAERAARVKVEEGHKVDEAARRQASEDRRAQIAAAEAQRAADLRKEEERMVVVRAEREVRLQAEQADRAERATEAQRKDRLAEAREEARVTALRKACGNDFGRPRVGMTIERARQCVADLALFGQNGSASLYRGSGLLVTVQGGRITRWVAP